MDNEEIDIETRLMMAEVGLQVADSMIRELKRKLDKLAQESRDS